MNFEQFASRSEGERRMRIGGRQLMTDALAILRELNIRALSIALVSTLVFIAGLKMHPLLSVALGAAVYAGVALLWQRSAPSAIVPIPLTLEEEAFQRMRASTAHVVATAEAIENPAIRERVSAIGQAFAAMLGVMELDKKKKQFDAAPDYEVRVVGPFEKKLEYYVYLSGRRVELAAPQLARFEQIELPRYEVLTKSFYQHYHDGDVIDFAALLEIFEDDGERDDEEAGDLLGDHDYDDEAERAL